MASLLLVSFFILYGTSSLGGGLVFRYVLAHPIHFPFPHNYALLFFLTFLGTSLGMLLFVFIREPTELPRVKKKKQLLCLS